MLRVEIVTLFPEQVLPGLRHSILARAERDGRVAFSATNPRDFASDRHRTVDDAPLGGGPGMVMKPDVIGRCLDALELTDADEVVFTEPWGERFSQPLADTLARAPRLVLVCGHYEGIDARVAERYATRVVSLGDFVLTGGELAAMVIADAVVRQVPGVLGDAESLSIDSHRGGLLGAPQYTRPVDWEGRLAPEVLTSGDHAAVDRFRRRAALLRTRERRPDLFLHADLSRADLDLLH